jgi:glutamate synthase (NADPH/NADH) small chain
VVVIGGGMTAIDAAVQAKKLGAEQVTIVYRRDQSRMGASRYEQELAQTNGVLIRHSARVLTVQGERGQLRSVRFAATSASENGGMTDTGEAFELEADQMLKAIGQVLVPGVVTTESDVLELSSGRIAVDAEHRTSLSGVWAGGDCVPLDRDLTVVAVEHGKRAADSIERFLRGAGATASR